MLLKSMTLNADVSVSGESYWAKLNVPLYQQGCCQHLVVCQKGLKARCPNIKNKGKLLLRVYDKPGKDRLPVYIKKRLGFTNPDWSQDGIEWTSRMTSAVRHFIIEHLKLSNKNYQTSEIEKTLYFTAKNV